MPTKKEIASLRELLRKANAEGELLSAAEKGRQLTNLLAYLESAVLLARRMAEEQPQPPIHQSARSPVWPLTEIAGSIETNEFGWLHITLNTLLPHCRFKTPAYLSDTIIRLVESHQSEGGRVPFFRKAILIIDEHCDLKNRQVFDQDNKGSPPHSILPMPRKSKPSGSLIRSKTSWRFSAPPVWPSPSSVS